MRLFTAVTEQAPGEWFPFRKAEGVEFQIRRLPGAKARELAFRHGGSTRQVNQKGYQLPLDKEFKVRLAQACWCLMDAKNAEVEIGDPASAQAYGQVLGREVKVGELVKLDGNLGNEALKDLVLSDWTEAINFVLEKAKGLAAEADESEEEARGNS